jgi:copper(I)-binding protein
MKLFKWGRKHPFLLLLFLLGIVVGLVVLVTPERQAVLEVTPGYLVTVREGADTYAVLEIENSGNADTKLVGASVSPKDGERAELHDKDMKTLQSVALPAGEDVLLTGDPHIMMLDASRDIMVGEKVNITLEFEGGVTEKVPFTVTQADGHNHKH